MFNEILFKMLLFKGGVLIYAEHCISSYRTVLLCMVKNSNTSIRTFCDFTVVFGSEKEQTSYNLVKKQTDIASILWDT